MKFKKTAFLIFLSGAILNYVSTNLAHSGAVYIYEMANPSDTGYAGAGLSAKAVLFAT